MVIDVEDPKLGKIRQVGILPKLSDMPGTVRRLAPLHGDHTGEILKALGYSTEEIQKLRQGKVVG
jgi:crotonobetainyl-CoA:carnitine CoA-transferase CaiB-like acyl-CoA transferase